MAFQEPRSLERWLGQEVVRTNDGTPPADLAWECEMCGPQPPVALANNRWVRRRCRCEREKLARQAAVEKHARLEHARLEPGASITPPGSSMTRMGHVLRHRMEPQEPPPDELLWRCPTCGPIPPVALPSGRWVRRACACERRAREEREREAALQAWRHHQLRRTFGGWLGPQWVDQEFIDAMAAKTFASYDMVRQPEAYEKALVFAKAPRGNLLFWGEDYGVGKTHLEAAICNYAREVGWPTHGGGLRPSGSIFVSAPQLFVVYNETRKAFDQTAHIRLMNALTGSPLLVLDDIDKKAPCGESDWELYWLICEARYTARRPTVFSTNKPEELARSIGEASLSRLSRGLVSVNMRGDDYRREEAAR